MPTNRKTRSKLKFILKDFSISSIAELGAGWGHLLFSLRKACPQSKIDAFELSIIPYACACVFNRIFHLNISLWRKNFLKQNLKPYDCIVCYLYPKGMEKLLPQLNTLPSKTKIISIAFTVPGWEIQKKVFSEDFWKTPIYLYEKV